MRNRGQDIWLNGADSLWRTHFRAVTSLVLTNLVAWYPITDLVLVNTFSWVATLSLLKGII